MSTMVSFVLSFFPRDVLDEILKLIESVSEDFPSYSYTQEAKDRFEAEIRDMARVSPSRTDMGMGVGLERVVSDSLGYRNIV